MRSGLPLVCSTYRSPSAFLLSGQIMRKNWNFSLGKRTCWVPPQLCIDAALLCEMTASPAERIWEMLNVSVLGKKKKEEIITIMIAVTPKSEEKCREPQNCYSSFQNCLSVTDGKKSFLETWGSFDVRAVCRQPGGEESCWCWAQRCMARCFGRCSMPGMQDGMWQHLCELCCFFPLGSLCLEATIIINLFWCSAWVIFLLSHFRRKRDYRTHGDTLLWSQIEEWRMTVIKFLLSTNLIC